MGTLDGKVALIAGGATGIGRATAELFAMEGARVVVFGRRAGPLAETVEAIIRAGGKAQAVAGDAALETDAARLVQTARAEFGGVDALVNCAAVRLRAPLTEISAADFAEVLRINLVGAFVLTKAVVPAMRERRGGSIIHIGSALGTVAAPDFSPYVASKGGVHQLARAAAHGHRDGCPRVPPPPAQAPHPHRAGRPCQRRRRRMPLPGLRGLPLRHGLHPRRRRRLDRVLIREPHAQV